MIKILVNLRTIDSEEVGAIDFGNPKLTGVILDTRPFCLDDYPDLRVISRVGVGLDNIDLDECKRRGIKVYRTPCDELYESVAEQTIYIILNLLRRRKFVRNLSSMTVGIIGYGHIGSRVGVLLAGFGCRVLGYDINIAMNSKDYVLENSDIVTVHVSGNSQVIGAEDCSLLGKCRVLVNMARGGCVNIEAIAHEVREGELSYGSDVDGHAWPTEYSLPKHRCLVSNHVGGSNYEARSKMERMAVEILLVGLRKP